MTLKRAWEKDKCLETGKGKEDVTISLTEKSFLKAPISTYDIWTCGNTLFHFRKSSIKTGPVHIVFYAS